MALSFLRTQNLPNQGSAHTFLKLRTCRTRVRPVPCSKLDKPGFRPGPFPEPRTCWTSVGPGHFSELRTQTPNQGSAGSELRTPNSELELRTPGKNTTQDQPEYSWNVFKTFAIYTEQQKKRIICIFGIVYKLEFKY